MSDQDRLFRQIPNLLLEVIDQSFDSHLCKARIGTSTQLFYGPVQIWPLGNDDTVPFGLKEIAEAGPAIVGDPAPWTNMMVFDIIPLRQNIDASCRSAACIPSGRWPNRIRDRGQVRVGNIHLSRARLLQGVSAQKLKLDAFLDWQFTDRGPLAGPAVRRTGFGSWREIFFASFRNRIVRHTGLSNNFEVDRGFNVYTGTVNLAEFDRVVTHADGAIGIQISQRRSAVPVRRWSRAS